MQLFLSCVPASPWLVSYSELYITTGRSGAVSPWRIVQGGPHNLQFIGLLNAISGLRSDSNFMCSEASRAYNSTDIGSRKTFPKLGIALVLSHSGINRCFPL